MARISRISRRVVDSKRHTQGFILTGGRSVSRSQAVTMASRNQISGVRVVNGPNGRYLQSTTSRSLYDLAMQDSSGRRVRNVSSSSSRSNSRSSSNARRSSNRS